MPHTSRIAVRLADLSHAQLVEIAAAGCEASTEVKNRADALLAAHKPLAQWAVEGVLLSTDLVPHLLAPLQLEDGAAAAVCSRWAEGWKATNEGRRRLREVALNFPQELALELTASSRAQDLLDKRVLDRSLEMAVIPGDDAQLVVKSGTLVDILARDMSFVSSFELPNEFCCIAASEEFLYSGNDASTEIRCLTHDGNEVAKYQDPDKNIASPVLGPGGLLFCVVYDDMQHEIVALDAQTLQPRHRFGLSLLNEACGMAVVGDELFVCDTGNDRLQVFSLAGEHRRSITGEWKRPLALCFVKDRLYLVEEEDSAQDDDGELINPLGGRRIFVLSLQGDILHVYTHPLVPPPGPSVDPLDLLTIWDICYFEGRLLASVRNDRWEFVGIIALVGC